MNRPKYIVYFFVLCLFIYSCKRTTVINNYYTVVYDSADHYKKLLTGNWVLMNCTGFDSLVGAGGPGNDYNLFYSYDTLTHTISVARNTDTSTIPPTVDHYLVDSMVLKIDSNGYYVLTEAFSKNGATTNVDSSASTWTYLWTNDSSSMLLLNPFGVEGLLALAAGGYSSSSGNLIVLSLDSARLVLAAKSLRGFGVAPYSQYERVDVRYTLKKR